MNAKEVKAIVDDFKLWHGNTYTLAMLIAEGQKEADAVIAEQSGQQEIADQIRGQ